MKHLAFALILSSALAAPACSQSAPSGNGPSGGNAITIEGILLDGSGVTLNHSAGGDALAFGTPRAQFIEMAGAAFGAIESVSACSDGSGQSIKYPDGFSVTFAEDRFVGWRSVQTSDDFLSMRRSWFQNEPNFTVGEMGQEGLPFSYGPSGAEVRGYFASDAADALLLSHEAGDNCS